MSVPVVWVTLHEGIKARGYYDQTLLEAIMDRTLWRPPHAFTFEHFLTTPTNADEYLRTMADCGAVVVVPSRHHEADVGWLIETLNLLPWAVVLLTSEEEWNFDWRKLADGLDPARFRFWVWQGIPQQTEIDARFMPCGWNPGTSEGLRQSGRFPEDRDLDWMFAGQVTHNRRQQCSGVLNRLRKKGKTKFLLAETDGYLKEAVPHGEYLSAMARTKFVPCPSGPKSLCTARVEEALEAGCVPIVDLVKPEDPQFDYWELVFPANPFLRITDWGDLPERLAGWQTIWLPVANRCWAYWQSWKRDKAHRLDDDIRAVSGLDNPGPNNASPQVRGDAPDDMITVIVTTSPTEQHPSTAHIEETINSVRDQLPNAEILVAIDGVRPEQDHLKDRYHAYVHRLLWLTNFAWHNVCPVLLPSWGHQANATKAALDKVTTPLILFVEHDTPLVGPIDWPECAAFVQSGEANMVQFVENTEIHPEHEGNYLDLQWISDETGPRRIAPAGEFLRTSAWWQRPHLASARFYRDALSLIAPEARTMIEDVMYGIVHEAVRRYGEAGWWDWRLWAYAPTGPEPLGMKRSRHLDSRGAEPKYGMTFKYEGDMPEGAPRNPS